MTLLLQSGYRWYWGWDGIDRVAGVLFIVKVALVWLHVMWVVHLLRADWALNVPIFVVFALGKLDSSDLDVLTSSESSFAFF